MLLFVNAFFGIFHIKIIYNFIRLCKFDIFMAFL